MKKINLAGSDFSVPVQILCAQSSTHSHTYFLFSTAVNRCVRSERPRSFEREAANERETHGLNPLKHSFSPLGTEITIFCRIFFDTMIRHALRYMSVFSACF